MPDPLHFLGVNRLHDFISMSDMKYNAIVNTGIKIIYCVKIPKDLVPASAQVEIVAKVFHGYNAGKAYEGIDERIWERQWVVSTQNTIWCLIQPTNATQNDYDSYGKCYVRAIYTAVATASAKAVIHAKTSAKAMEKAMCDGFSDG